MRKLRIPSGFIIGAATSAYQVEGNNVNADWWHFEGDKLPKCGMACDFWNRYREDIELAASLGLKALRVSIAWDRIMPSEGRVDDNAMDRYVDMVKEIRGHGMEPIVTLHHFVNPIWFMNKGGWVKGDNVKYFLDFVRYVSDSLGNSVKYWLTINEINLYPILAYLLGVFPPFIMNMEYMWRAFVNLLKANDAAYDLVKREGNQVGLVIHISPAKPASRLSLMDWGLAMGMNYVLNRMIVDVLSRGTLPNWLGGGEVGKLDYVGLNYYAITKVRFNPLTMGEVVTSKQNQRGWVIDPGGLRWAIKLTRRIRKPIMITENGIATDNDNDRVKFIKDHLAIAIKEGTIGYLYWSLMDNYEWEIGYSAKFGLIECDPVTLVRRPRASAYFLGKVASSGELPL